MSLDSWPHSLEADLQKRIDVARQSALSSDDYEELKLLREERELSGNLDPVREDRYQTLEKLGAASEVAVSSIMEYNTLLKLLEKSQDRVNHLLNHENAHANMAEQVPSQSLKHFRVSFRKDDEGKIYFTTGVKTNVDNSFSERQRLEDEILVAEAPLHAGDRLSKGDKEILEKAKKRLSQIP